ncbi:hypothetical protein QLX08_005777 [Tetragonisca angustula]|uniref:Uncharacterized protein n=1 Tax=Tetragonisca angustula TaxID=166442 RepID=A0AAW0ZWZ3_9HYME
MYTRSFISKIATRARCNQESSRTSTRYSTESRRRPFFERAAGCRWNRRDHRDFGTCHDKRLDLSDVRGTARHDRCPELHFNLREDTRRKRDRNSGTFDSFIATHSTPGVSRTRQEIGVLILLRRNVPTGLNFQW